MMEFMRTLIRRWGVWRAALVAVAVGVLLSIAITLLANMLVGARPGPLGWTLTLLSPVVIGLPLALLQFHLIERLDQAERELAQLAAHDDLTQVYNRREFNRQALQTLSLAAHTHEPMGCLLLDVDHFKQVNDDFGHLAGDEALKAIAAYLKHRIQPPAILSRFGGDEFLILLPGMDEKAAYAFAERMRSELEALPVETANGPVQVTVSIGVFVTRAVEASLDLLVHEADSALYHAKKSGRNRVVSNPGN